MLRNYLKVAIRSLSKNRLYSFINIAGLTIGIVSCILIGLYINDEIHYDKFQVNADRIVRATMEYSSAGTVNQVVTTGTKVGPQLKRTFPAIEDFTRTLKSTRVVSYETQQFEEKNFLYADSSFLKVFSFPLLEGNAATALNSIGKVIITPSVAKKYFGDEPAMGKTLEIGNSGNFEVTGIAAPVPGNSQIQFDMVASFDNLSVAKTEEWFTANYITYFLLHDKNQLAAFQEQVNAYMMSDVRKELGFEGTDYLTYHFEPLKDIHLYSRLEGFEPNGNIMYVYVLAIIALLIIAIACVNYTNLAIAQFSGRSGEIGIRKVMGALRGQLFAQFIGESFILTSIALVFAVFLCAAFLPLMNAITGKHFTTALLFQPVNISMMLGLLVFVSLSAGIYPALILSNTGIIKILKSGFSFSTSGGTVKKSLIVFQFAISIFLLTSTSIMLRQLSFIRNKNLGYDKEHIVVLPVDGKMRTDYASIKKAMTLVPGVINVCGAYEPPTFVQWGDGIEAENGTAKKELSVNAIPSDADFIKTMEMQLIAGEDFTQADLTLLDTSQDYKNYQNTFILNETAVRELGWTPEQAIGQTISKGTPGKVKGVVKDFHFASLHQPIGPMIIFLNEDFVGNLFVKISGDDITSTLQQLEKTWKQRVPHRPFEYRFLDDEYNQLYTSDQRSARIIGIAAGIAILLACLGLFGLAAFTMVQRTKEIGIRKILGAGLSNIFLLVTGDFLKLICIALLVATPIAWYAGNQWLQDFAYRVSIEWWVFALAGAVTIIIALLTLCFHSIKIATANPIRSLRTE